MSNRHRPRRSTRRIPSLVVAGLIAVAAIAAWRGYPLVSNGFATAISPEASSPVPASVSSGAVAAPSSIPPTDQPSPARTATVPVPGGESVLAPAHRGALGTADGVLPDGTTAFDDEVPGIANLDRDLLTAVRRATAAAERQAIRIVVTSGWRSRRYQEALFRQAVLKYGSDDEAARWVATPGTSSHESGEAVDIAPSAADTWLSRHGAGYGLCRVYRNEPWHFELRLRAIDHGCPRMYADPTEPRTYR